jgi:hypothetical protein
MVAHVDHRRRSQRAALALAHWAAQGCAILRLVRGFAVGSVVLIGCLGGTPPAGDEGGTTQDTTSSSTSDPSTSSSSTSTSEDSSTGVASSSEETGAPMGYQQTIVLETSVLEEILYDVPVLVRLVPESIDYDAIAPDGSDVRFFSADEELLPFEVEAWHPGGITDVWVLLPQARPDEDTIEIRFVYGQPMPPDTMPSSEVWRGGYVAVWHLPSTIDASGHGHDLAPVGAMPESVMGVVGESLRFVDPSEPLHTPDASPFELGGSATIEAWVRPIELGNASPEDRIVVGKGESYRLVTVGSTTDRALFTVTLGGGTAVTAIAPGDLTTEWTLLAGMLDQSNGNTTVCLWYGLPAPVCQGGSLGAILGAPEPLQIGSAFAGADIDEVRFANLVRPASWQRLQLRSLQAGFATFGDPEPL